MKPVQKTIIEVAAALSAHGIEKGQRNDHGKYNFRGIDDVYDTLSGIMAKCGLFIRPVEVKDKTLTLVKTSGGKDSWQCTLTVSFAIGNDEGSEIYCQFPGEALDTSDKATNKAMTAAYKYLVFQVFCIPVTSQDPDADHLQAEAPQEFITLEQVVTIQGWMAKTNTEVTPFLEWQQIPALDQLPAARFDTVINALQRKEKRLAEEYAQDAEDYQKSMEQDAQGGK